MKENIKNTKNIDKIDPLIQENDKNNLVTKL